MCRSRQSSDVETNGRRHPTWPCRGRSPEKPRSMKPATLTLMARTSRPRHPPPFAATPATPEGVAEHPWYRACRDHVTKRGVRIALTRIWNELGHLLPESVEQFFDQFRRDFPQRSWELYVLAWLARSGSAVERSPSTGPDFCARHPRIGRFGSNASCRQWALGRIKYGNAMTTREYGPGSQMSRSQFDTQRLYKQRSPRSRPIGRATSLPRQSP